MKDFRFSDSQWRCIVAAMFLTMIGYAVYLGLTLDPKEFLPHEKQKQEEERRAKSNADAAQGLHRFLDEMEKNEPALMREIDSRRQSQKGLYDEMEPNAIIDTHLDGIRAPKLPADDLGLRDSQLPTKPMVLDRQELINAHFKGEAPSQKPPKPK